MSSTGTTTPAEPEAATAAGPPRASRQDGRYPRPQLVRRAWADLGGPWQYHADPRDEGLDQGWWQEQDPGFGQAIQVPYPPESPASGIGDPETPAVVWYRRRLTAADLAAAGWQEGRRLLLHLGAVDQSADVWLGGHHVAAHQGGQTPVTADLAPALLAFRREHGAEALPTVAVRAADDPQDVTQPRGKQDWRRRPHSIWYHRTTGIWQPVWLESVARQHLTELAWEADVPDGSVLLTARTARPAEPGEQLTVRLTLDGELLAEQQLRLLGQDVRLRLDLPRQANGQQHEEILWSPERPTLVDAELRLGSGDAVSSYLGLRSVGTAHGRFLLNDRPYYLRSVLEQGYWPESHLAAPRAEALREEVQLIKDLGFNSARIHQKAEDPRFLYWADRLGLAVWAETANAYAFSPRAVGLLSREWLELVRRDRSHPSIVTWVPLNESWGVQHGAHDAAQQHYGLALAQLTRALDGTRPVVSNDGWEHTDSDIWTVHDYSSDGEELRRRYGTEASVAALLAGIGPAGRRMRLADAAPVRDRGQPLMVTEFGGVSFDADREDGWGYSTASDPEDYARRVGDLIAALRDCPPVAGFCWTQLTDTGQETNGLLRADRSPKLPVERIRALVTGEDR